MQLRWAITNREGREWGWLWDRTGGEVVLSLNGQATAMVETSLEERITNFIHPGKSRCKVWISPEAGGASDAALLANNLIVQPRAVGRRVEVPSVDQSIRLLNASPSRLPKPGDDRSGLWGTVHKSDGELMWTLIDRSDFRVDELIAEDDGGLVPLTLGIRRGSIEDSGKERDTQIAEGKTTFDQLFEVSQRDHGPDFELVPLDREDGVFADFNTYYPRMGANRRDEVILEYGHNLAEFAWEPTGVDLCNRYVAVGRANEFGVAPCYVAECRPSIGIFGVWQREESADTEDADKLKDIAEAYVAQHAYQINNVEATPAVEIGGTARHFTRDDDGTFVAQHDEYAIPPRFGPRAHEGFDYWLGDTITVRAKEQFTFEVDRGEPGPLSDLYCRVIGATLREIDASANAQVVLQLVPVPNAADVGGYESTFHAGGVG